MLTSKRTVYLITVLMMVIPVVTGFYIKQDNEPWNRHHLLEPSVLAETLTNSQHPQPVIYSIGREIAFKKCGLIMIFTIFGHHLSN